MRQLGCPAPKFRFMVLDSPGSRTGSRSPSVRQDMEDVPAIANLAGSLMHALGYFT